MIIDLLQDKSNIVTITYKDESSSNLLSQSFTTKSLSDILSWKVYNTLIDKIQITITSNSRCILKDIIYNLPAWVNNNSFTIETSIDYINWYELPYVNTSTSATINDKYYFYKSVDTQGNITYLYDNYGFKMLRFTFSNLAIGSNILKFNNLEIKIDETFDLNYARKDLLSIRSSMFSKSKIFNEQPFLADMITTYTKMLETGNTLNLAPEYKNTYLQKTNFSLTSN